ncbi:hypothetical protein CWI38_0338p0010 [Hamiltosporidium tvaerminnensis]|uniref:Uncharacterized protein n=2 Tax=Hamiltosporidium TaxID=1176354 RepID=A0A4Q9LGL6_9MICR|nr:hypothetical protein CWI36_0302p0020 [Hamiltosporidium magnivora]TBU13796.1 hypothetical protein CWI38_0338p0010 [Hamiltosporidium tvaerminnensis]
MRKRAGIDNDEYDDKHFKTKNNTPFYSDEGTTLEEPKIRINEDSDIEAKKLVVKWLEEIHWSVKKDSNPDFY